MQEINALYAAYEAYMIGTLENENLAVHAHIY